MNTVYFKSSGKTMQNRSTRNWVLDLPLVFFLTSAVLAIFPAYDRNQAWISLMVLLLGGAVYFGLSRLAVNRKAGVWIARASALAGGGVAVYFITQYAHYPGPDKVEMVWRLTEAIGRLFPTFVIWTPLANSVAALLEGLFFLAIGTALAEPSRAWRGGMGATAGLMGLALVLTESRGAWLGVLLAGLVWVGLYQRPVRWLLAIVGVGLLALIAVVVLRNDITILGRIPIVDQTLAPLFIRPDRLTVYQGSLALIQDVPLSGIGLGGQFAMNYSKYILLIQVPFLIYSHNLYLEIWLEQGLFGIAAWVWLMTALFHGSWCVRKTGRDPFMESTWIGMMAILLHGVTDARQSVDLWCWIPVFLLLGLFAGLLVGRSTVVVFKRRWFPAAVMGLFVLWVTVTLPSLPAVWQANQGSLLQARADLTPGISDEARLALTQQAEAYLRQAILLAPEERSPQVRLGLILMKQEKFAEALDHLEIAYTIDPANATTCKALGLAYAWNGEIEKAGVLLRDAPNIEQEMNDWGSRWTYQNQTDLARNAYEVSLHLNPNQMDVLEKLKKLVVRTP
jgi:tetratricopeptide (TPR) repeat protein